MELLYKDITEQIIGAAFEVHRILGYGFLEKVYQRAMMVELRKRGIEVEEEVLVKVFFKEECVGDYYADLVVENKIVVELKVAKDLNPADEAQLINGAGGFIGSHLVKRLKAEGYWVRAVDIKLPEFAPTAADEFYQADLREEACCQKAVMVDGQPADEVYQLAADMGGMGFIHSAECEIMHNSVLINIHMTHAAAAAGVPRYFFSSSVCVYRDMKPGEPEMTEAQAVPANPDNEYGWEKLYSERMAQAYGRHHGMQVRIARFQNCYGPEGTWRGGREKAPAALCRKIAEAPEGGTSRSGATAARCGRTPMSTT
jgi:GxxExxY protein